MRNKLFEFLAKDLREEYKYDEFLGNQFTSEEKQEYNKAIRFLELKELIKIKDNMPMGRKIIKLTKFNEAIDIGLQPWLDKQKRKNTRKEDKEDIDYQLAREMLNEYPRTKLFAKIGFFIGIGLALLELIKYLVSLRSSE